MAKAMGLNTVPIYVFWNDHEREPGKFDFTTDERNIGDFLDIARQEGMWVLLRPGPYICGEWDLGGLPWWLLRTPDIKGAATSTVSTVEMGDAIVAALRKGA